MKNGKGMTQWSVEKRILKTEWTAGAASKTELQGNWGHQRNRV